MVRLKGLPKNLALCQKAQFQFLMVRLKDKAGTHQAGCYTVFQFLMVRLKERLLKLPF